MTSSALMFGRRPIARVCSSSWSSNIARPSWAFIGSYFPLIWFVIPSLSLQYEATMSLVKFESTVRLEGERGRTLGGFGLGRAATAAPNGPEGQAGPGDEEQTAEQDWPYGQGQEEGVVEIVLGEAEEGHDQDRDHAQGGPTEEGAQLGLGGLRQSGAVGG